MFVFFASGAVLATLYIKNITSELSRLLTLHEIEDFRQELIINTQVVQSDLYTVRTPLEHELDSIVMHVSNLERAAVKCTTCHHSPEMTQHLTGIQKLIQDYQRSLSYYITASADIERIDRLKLDAASIGNQLLKNTEKMSFQASKKLASMTSVALTKIEKTKTILYITIVLTFFIGIVSGIRLTMSITRPISELVNATRRIASGDLGFSISYKDGTEFGELSSHFNLMTAELQKSYAELQKEIQERKNVEDTLRESEERYRSFVQNFQGIAFRGDISYKPTFLHGAVQEITGYNEKEFVDGDVRWDTIIHPADLQSLAGKTELRTVPNFSLEREYRIVRKGGDIKWIHEVIRNVVDKDGKPFMVEGAIFDVTDRKRMEDDLIKSHKLESIGILAGGIAHDFNNILTAILGNISLAETYVEPESELAELLLDSEKASIRARDLTQQLLTFSKGGEPVKKAISICRLIKESANFALMGSNVKCSYRLPYDVWPVEVDEGQIGQVINNLVINAMQAMPEGGEINVKAENISVGTENAYLINEGDYVRITIEDHGIGIKKEHLQKVFDPYFTTKQKGSGLGLAIVYSIIKKHNGYISVESDQGTGTTFEMLIPASEDQIEEQMVVKEDQVGFIGSILVMDDEKVVRNVAGRILSRVGYFVEFAANGAEAIERYKMAMESGQPFDAVIMDLTIPGGMGGREAIKKLLEIDPDIKAIVSSGYSNDPVIADFKSYGFCEFIAKPYSRMELSRKISQVLRKPDE
jgi:PAS domain S-box-containing protein